MTRRRRRSSWPASSALPVGAPVAHFTPITLANQVTLDYDQHDDFEAHHYAFLVSDEEFDAAFARIQDARRAPSSPTPAAGRPDQIYRSHGRRGAYFRDPNGHLMEILTPGG